MADPQQLPLVTPVSPEDGGDGLLARRASTSLLADKKGSRGSILAESFVAQASTQQQETLRVISRNVLFQVIAFVLLVIFTGTTPIFQRTCLTEDENGNKIAAFIENTPYLMDYVYTIVLANVIAAVAGGFGGVKDCWSARTSLRFAPALMLIAVAEALQMYAMKTLDGTSWRLIGKLKLPMSALGIRFILGRREMPATQWILLCLVSSTLFGYCFHSAGNKSLGGFSFSGAGLGVLSMFLSCSGEIYSDYLYKTVHNPLYVQMAHSRLPAAFAGLIFTIAVCAISGDWSRFLLGGWSWHCWVLAVWLMLKDWSTAFVLKHLDSVFRALAAAAALVVTFGIDVAVGSRILEPVSASFIVSVTLCVVAFAVVKRDIANASASGIKKF